MDFWSLGIILNPSSNSNGGRMISDDDLKDLIIDLHPQSSSNKEQVWNELVTKQNNSVFYNAKCCKLEVNEIDKQS